ncbi:hypothetical protein BKA93DRAFT_796827 [Sparassis latifolia]
MLPPRGYIFIGLNVVRILSIVSLLLVFASSIFVIVTDVEAVNRFMALPADQVPDCDYVPGSDVPNQPAGIFWAILNRLLIIFEVIVLIMSEIGWPAAFFERFFPVLGRSFGLGSIGTFQCLLGAAILSHHVDDFTLVAAFFLFALGCVNILAGLIFREKAKWKRSITEWRNERKGVLPRTLELAPKFTRPSSTFVSNLFGKTGRTTETTEDPEKRGYGFGRQGEKAAAHNGYVISRPLESMSRYAPAPRNQHPPSHHSVQSDDARSEASEDESSHYPNTPQTTYDAPHYPVLTKSIFKSSNTAL